MPLSLQSTSSFSFLSDTGGEAARTRTFLLMHVQNVYTISEFESNILRRLIMLSCHYDIVISSMLKLLYKNPVNKNRAVVKIVTDAIRGCAKGYHVKSSSSRGMLWCQIECTLAAQLRGRRAEQLDRAGGGGRGRRIMCSGLILFRSANFCAKPGIGTRIADTVIFKIEN